MTEIRESVEGARIEAQQLREPTGDHRVAVALERLGSRLDQLEARKSDADLGHAFKQGRGILVPLVSVVVAVVAVLGWFEVRAGAVARTAIQAPETRAQVAEQIHAQVDPLTQVAARREDIVALQAQVAALRESLGVSESLRRIEQRLPARAPARRQEQP